MTQDFNSSFVAEEAEQYLSKNWELMLEDMEKLISIPSIEERDKAEDGAPFGPGPRKSLTAALGIAKEMGFDTHDMQGYIGYADLEGESDRQIAIIGHTDVVPAGPGWTFEPYTVTRKDGYLLGRGTSDDKAPLLMALHAVKFWKDLAQEQGRKFPYTIRVIFGANEETQMDDVKYYLKHEQQPAFLFTPDAEFPVSYGEKGVANFVLRSKKIEKGNIVKIEGGTAVNAVPGLADALVAADSSTLAPTDGMSIEDAGTDETGRKLCRLHATGKSAHASTPELGINAIGVLLHYILDNSICSDDERGFLELLTQAIDHTDGSGLGISAEDEHFGPLTLACGIISMENGVISQTLDVRFPTTITVDEMVAKISEKAFALGATLETTMQKPTFLVDPNSDVIQALLSAYNEATGEHAEPFTMGGGTYARMFEKAASFGSDKPWELKPEWVGSMHGPDEGISENLLKQAFKIYCLTIGKLMQLDL